MNTETNPSLWWKLSSQLSLVFVAVVAAVIVGLCVYGAMILAPAVGLQNKLTLALQEAFSRDAQGRFVVTESPALRAFKAENDKLWFVAATEDGETASYGSVPAAYAELGQFIRFVKDADIRGAKDVGEAASIDTIGTASGEVRVMYGGNTSKTATFLTMLVRVYPIYVPLLAISLPALFFVVPRIVKSGLAPVNDVAGKAAEIDSRRQGARLPTDGIPKEVAPLVIAFNGVLERLEHEFEKRQRFLIDAAHELRTPIAIMQARIEGMPAGQDRRRLMDDVARLGETAEQLLDFERNDQATDLHEIIDVVDMTRTVVADFAPLAISAGYEISFESDVDRIEREGSPSALPRAIGNLVRNAIDHGGGAGAITVRVSAAGDIAVSDEGPGIPFDQQELIFEPFYRVTPRSRGAGLGLSLVRQIVSNHRGRVLIESSPAGTTFTIQI